MKTDFTIVGKVRNAETIEKLVAGIREKGHSCYCFLEKTDVAPIEGKTWSKYMEHLESHPDFWNDPEHRQHFEDDLAGMKNADAVIVVFPIGNASHIESGIAYGLGKRIIMIGEAEKNETLYLIFEERYPTVEAFLETL